MNGFQLLGSSSLSALLDSSVLMNLHLAFFLRRPLFHILDFNLSSSARSEIVIIQRYLSISRILCKCPLTRSSVH